MCGTRYYDPEVGRFISPDSINYLDPQSINGLNLYCYCKNNPIMMVDPNGTMPFFVLTGIIGAVAGAITGGIIAAVNGQNVWAGIGVGFVAGGLIGMGLGAVYAATVAGSFAASVGTVKVGTMTTIGMFKAGGAAAGFRMVADNWSNAVNSFTHVFWSGGDLSKNSAKYFANDVGGKTLEMTRVGRYLESIPYNAELWRLASQNFANQVSSGSSIFVFQNFAGIYLSSMWATTEYPILKNIAEIIYIMMGGG